MELCICRGCKTLQKFNVLQNILFQARMFFTMKSNREKEELATVTSSLEQNGINKAEIGILAHGRKLNIPLIDWDVQDLW